MKTMDTCISSSNDMLIEILIRLPPKSVFKFRCVSKRWNNLIMDPFFVTSYNNCKRRKENLLGFIQSGNLSISYTSYYRHIRGRWGPTHIFLSTTAATTIGYYNGCFPSKLGYFISSSNGLILCGQHPMTYHVINPITKHHVSLPLPPKHYPAVSVGLVCEESIGSDLVVCYKVVQASIIPSDTGDTTLPIQTYSSLTGKWTESTLIAPCEFMLHPFVPPSVIRGIFHWFAMCDMIAVYEPGGENHHHLQLIELPFDAYRHSDGLGRSDDGRLWYGESTPTNFTVWVLPKTHGYSTIAKEEWILVHIVSSYTLRKNWNPIISRRENSDAQLYHPKPLRNKKSVFFVGFAPWDPQVVILRLRQSITLYHLKTNVMESVPFRGCSYTDYYDWQPYFQSLSLSSYLL